MNVCPNGCNPRYGGKQWTLATMGISHGTGVSNERWPQRTSAMLRGVSNERSPQRISAMLRGVSNERSPQWTSAMLRGVRNTTVEGEQTFPQVRSINKKKIQTQIQIHMTVFSPDGEHCNIRRHREPYEDDRSPKCLHENAFGALRLLVKKQRGRTKVKKKNHDYALRQRGRKYSLFFMTERISIWTIFRSHGTQRDI